MTKEEILHWLDVEIETWENECQSKHPIKEALYEARKALEQKTCKYAVSRAEVKKIAKETYLEVANMDLDAKTISDCISYTSSKCREVLERKLQGLPPVTPQEPTLDKIREEIVKKHLSVMEKNDFESGRTYGYEEILEIIDKYKAESE